MISLLTPTRHRPELFKQMLASLRDTAKTEVEVVAYVSEDDWALPVYRNIQRVKMLVGPNIILAEKANECWRAASGDICMTGNDDIAFRTPGWDQMIEEAFAACPDKIIMVHGFDHPGDRGKKFGGFTSMHQRWIRALGYFLPPQFAGDWSDVWINDLANALGRRRQLPFTIEHFHWAYGTRAKDETNLERFADEAATPPDKLYESLAAERNADVEKLRALMGSSPMKWSILIPTMPCRKLFLDKLLAVLRPQVAEHADVEIIVHVSSPALTLGQNRDAARRKSCAQYISFIDDDDLVPPNHVASIYPLLDGVDYVGFRLQEWFDLKALAPTFHSLKFKNWSQDGKGYYRDLTLVNPIKRELAMMVPIEGSCGEDVRWAAGLRKLGMVKTERYVDAVMYFYYARSRKDDSPEDLCIGMPGSKPGVSAMRAAQQVRMGTPQPFVSKLVPDGACPSCLRSAHVVWSNGQRVCNSCRISLGGAA